MRINPMMMVSAIICKGREASLKNGRVTNGMKLVAPKIMTNAKGVIEYFETSILSMTLTTESKMRERITK